MCSDAGKRFHEGKSNKQALLHTLEEMLGTGEASNFTYGDEAKALRNSETGNTVSVCKCITAENITAEDKLISGTYCHPDLIPHIGLGSVKLSIATLLWNTKTSSAHIYCF